MATYTHPPKEPIAIIGSGCRFPGNASSSSRLWNLLASPRDLSRRVPETRFNPDGFYHVNGEHHGASNVTKSYFLDEDPRLFDSVFFNITPREAEAIDPQQRLLLETVFEAMESAGLTIKGLQGSQTSAYVGIMTADYTDTHARDPELFSQYQATGTSRSLVSNRLSYFFDWKGPSMTVDTACSSSLTAIHLASQSLRSGESEVACAAGANLLLGPDLFIGATSLHMISPSGKSQMWDAGADGYARGEGIAAVFLKTLSQALKDGDRIEALIRETGVNSDGRTKGITLPSPEAQARLIRDTYQNAGLDILDPKDRPQYFEAHGTGTQAGDPREASAIKSAFFPNEEQDTKLLVGSIKTIIGHTEGCAGIAGVLKASLAMQNKTVPPNQHLKNLNPSVSPSYGNLRIPTEITPWPEVPKGHPLRASVNSFGFGGTNSHAIIETYVPELHDSGPWGKGRSSLSEVALQALDRNFSAVPLVLSANSDKALIAMATGYAEFLRSEKVNISHLTWTLQARRTALPHKICFSGTTQEDILADIEKKLAKIEDRSGVEFGFRSSFPANDQDPRILGIFTGQGAQWPQMGRHLILNLHRFRSTIEVLEESLRALPDPPTWSLTAELMAEPATSRLDEASISQPLCTAVQVALVDMLKDSGVVFHTVVGHSSGEIAAAYAAGRISAVDAIRIAYYRGVHAKLARGRAGQKGSMIAVGFGIGEARSFCSSPDLLGRLAVAASNASGSVTLSGDEDAVQAAKKRLDAEGLFNRVLKVDTAYHSHHMEPCAEAYVESLRSCDIQVQPGNGRCTWVSSVYGSSRTPTAEELRGSYWRDNMVQTVLFSQAVDQAVDVLDPFDLILEVGPHPALRGPTLQTAKEKLGREIPHAGVLDRKKNDVVAFSDALGSIWTRLGAESVDFSGYYASATAGAARPTPMAGLPTYPWEHDSVLWRESRLNKQFRSRSQPPHELLGVRTPDDTPHEPRWRNLLKLEELPWLGDHRVQGQVVVPGATYCVMALEAAKVLSGGRALRMVELRDLVIQRAIVLDEASEATETLFSLRETGVRAGKSGDYREIITADFSLSAGAVEDGVMRKVCHGELHIYTGDDPEPMLPHRPDAQPGLSHMSIERFYSSVGEIGLQYSGPFKGLIYAERRMDLLSGVVARHDVAAGLPVHPTWLDVCFQALFAAFAAPGDGTLWTAFVPSSIRRIKFGPMAGVVAEGGSPTYSVDAYLTGFQPAQPSLLSTITGDISVFNGSTGAMDIQIEDLIMTALLPSTPSDDRQMYLRTVWKEDINSGIVVPDDIFDSGTDLEVADACDLVAFDYLQKLEKSIAVGNKAGPDNPFRPMLEDQHHLAKNRGSEHQPHISSIKNSFRDSIDMQLVAAVGDNLLKKYRGQNHQQGLHSTRLLFAQLLRNGIGAHRQSTQLLHAVKQIIHRYPRLRILQVGADSNVDLRSLVAELGEAFGSYTVVDESSTALNELQGQTSDPRVKFLQLRMGEDLAGQEVEPGSFELAICSRRSSWNAPRVLGNVRALLRPGGYLLFLDLAHDVLRHSFVVMGLGLLDGSVPANLRGGLLSPVRWDKTLRESGFTGVDGAVHDSETLGENSRVLLVSQATDDVINLIRHPLEVSDVSRFPGLADRVLFIGGRTLKTKKVISKLRSLMRTWDIDVVTTESLRDLDADQLLTVDSVVSLADLDSPTFKHLDAKTLANLQQICNLAKIILWVTTGATGDDPYHSAIVGLGRTILSENPQLSLQLIDVDAIEGSETFLAESFIRLKVSNLPGVHKDSHLWSVETELAVVGGKVMIPRVVLDVERNNRLNSNRRVINSTVNVADNPVKIETSDQGDTRRLELLPYPSATKGNIVGTVWLDVECSSANPVVLQRGGGLYVCIGTADGNGSRLVAFSPENASRLGVKRDGTIRCDLIPGSEAEVLSALACFIQASAITASITRGQTAVVVGADRKLIRALRKTVLEAGKKVIFLTTDQSVAGYEATVVVHPQASERQVRAQLPGNIGIYIDCSTAGSALEKSLVERLAAGGAVVKSGIHTTTIAPDVKLDELLSSALRLAKTYTLESPNAFSSSAVSVSELVSDRHKAVPWAIVDWTLDQKLTIQQLPTTSHQLFRGDRTYILFGLTGQIGQSITRWMVSNAARHIVVASRNPSQDAAWKDELRGRGAVVRVEAVDITDKSDVGRLCREVESTMPPVAGVANGAMVLSDGLFADMSLEGMQRVLRPKMEGSRILDEVFGSRDLDFFIIFSSLSGVIGMPSQSNYAAANMYMVGLAAQRRKRGLAASVVDLGMILGIGYISRAEGDEGKGTVETSLRKQNYMPVAERDMHHILTEAIVAGKYGPPDECEIITGLERYDPSAENHPVWLRNPRFSHLIKSSASADKRGMNSAEKSLRAELDVAEGVDEAVEILERYFAGYLAATLKLLVNQISVSIPIIDLGIDSLVAVEIRTWFSAETGQDIPVLKILGGATIRQLCTEVAAGLSLGPNHREATASTVEVEARIESDVEKPGQSPSTPSPLIDSLLLPATPNSEKSTIYATDGADTPPSSVQSVVGIGSKQDSPAVVRIAPLSLGQARFYFPSLYLDDKSPFNCTTSYRITGPLDLQRLAKALRTVTQRHEILRTSFTTDPATGKGVQSVLETSTFQMKTISSSDETAVEAEFRRMHSHAFDLERGDTLRATVLSHSTRKHTIIFGYHHIVMDGVSWQVFLQDAADYYSDAAGSPLNMQYIDFAKKQADDLSSDAYKERLEYWKSEFPTPPDPMPLFPFAKVSVRKAVTHYKTRDVVTHVDREFVARIRQAAQGSRATSFHFWFTVFQAMLYRFLSVPQLCIGIVDANRSDQAFAKTIGFLLEIMPVKFVPDGTQKFSTMVQNTRSKIYGALGRSGVPIEEIARACGVPASTTETPLFQAVFNYRMGATRTPDMDGVKMGLLDYADATTPFDLSISVDEKDDGTGMITFAMLDYLYDSEGADILVNTYKHMLDVLSRDPSIVVDDIPLFPPAMIDEAVALGTGPVVLDNGNWPRKETVSQRIASWAAKDPDAVAVKDMTGSTKTYYQVSRRADAIAGALRRVGVSAGSFVCVLSEPTVDTVSYILAILRLGAIYVPLDIRNTDERLLAVIEESMAGFLLFQTATKDRAMKLRRQDTKCLNLSVLPQDSSTAIVIDVSKPDSLAFVLYTSGSTGRPKGIALTNINMSVQNASVTQRLNLGREVVLQQSGLGFDASLCQIFMCLCNGGTLVMGDNRGDPADLAALVERERVTFTICMMSEMAAIIRHGREALARCSSSWRLAMCAGEAFTPQLAELFAGLDLPGLRVVNAYGPTEGTIMATIGDVAYREITTASDATISVGEVIPGYGVYIVDDDDAKPLPRGWPGQVALAGPGIASGYLHNPDLTDAKFRPDTISPRRPPAVAAANTESAGRGRLYLTGDKGRLLRGGRFVILGRTDGDSQVKLRGMRVELQEVARAMLRASEGVLADAAVVARGGGGGGEGAGRFLVAFVVFAGGHGVDDAEAYLAGLVRGLPLPAYMRPALAVPIDSLPVTGRGKLDTRALAALPLPELSGTEDDDAAADELTETESRLRGVWRDVLSEVGVNLAIKKTSDFFSVGGNSLLLMQLRVKIRKTFDVDIPLVELFQSSTLEALAARLSGTAHGQEAIDWEEETRPGDDRPIIPPQLWPQPDQTSPPAHDGGPITVLLTGATGFLGSGLLRHLQAHPRVSRIHCVAIRPGRSLPLTSPKIVPHAGDLSLPLLGMDPSEAASVLAETHVIIHNGAAVSHLKSYATLSPANVASTRVLARLALASRRRSPPPAFHLVSTAGVARLSGRDALPEVSLAAHPPPTDGTDGYVATKWAGERLLERAAAGAGVEGWRVYVHRPSSITAGDGGDGVPGSDITHNTLRYSRLLRAVPDLAGATGAFDFVDVETISARIVGDAVESVAGRGEGGRGVVYRHQSGETVVPVGRLREFLGHSEEAPFEVLEMDAWVKAAVGVGMDELVGSFLAATKGRIHMPLLVRGDEGI